jgi:hypothetical protein
MVDVDMLSSFASFLILILSILPAKSIYYEPKCNKTDLLCLLIKAINVKISLEKQRYQDTVSAQAIGA